MSEKTFVGRSLNNLEATPRNRPYSKVVVIVDENTRYTAGDDTGETLEVKTPWGSQRVADDLLTKYRGFSYQPYTASGASLDPAAEIGDGATVGRVYGGIYRQTIKFGPVCKSDFSAPQSEQINHEFPFKSRKDREINRTFGQLKSELRVQAGLISAEVTARKSAVSDLSGKIEVQAGLISEKVSQTGGAEDGSFEYELRPTYALWKANGADLLRLSAGRAELHADIYAENGYFHGTVRAGKIDYGGNAGYMSGSGLVDSSITHTQVAGHTLGTSVLQTGVNTSLGYGDFSNEVFNNRDFAPNVGCQTLTVRGQFLGLNGKVASWKTATIGGKTITYLGR